MKRTLFDYTIEPEKIAQFPLAARSSCRLLSFNKKNDIEDRLFADLPLILNQNDLLILNNTKVIKARLIGSKEVGGGRVEIFIERLTAPRRCLAQVRASKRPKVGTYLLTQKGVRFLVEKHYDYTNSEKAKLILDQWETFLPKFIKVSLVLVIS